MANGSAWSRLHIGRMARTQSSKYGTKSKPSLLDALSWFSRKVMAREDHMPITPGGRPWLLDREASSRCGY